MMKCGGGHENVRFQLGDYQLKTHMLTIYMGGCDMVLGIEWIQILEPITMDFKELYLSISQGLYTHTLKGF